MLDAAHASAWHWRAIGTELQHMRANMLLAEVHAIHAHAAHAAGQAEAHAAAYRAASASIAAIADDEDRAIVLKTFGLVPTP